MSGDSSTRAVVERLIADIWNARRLDLLGEVFAEHPTVHRGGSGSHGGEDLIGLGAFVAEHLQTSFAAFSEFRQEIVDLVVDGDRAAIRFRGYGTWTGEYMGRAPSGRPFRYEGIAILRIEDGRIAEIWTQTNLAKQLAAG